jgi:hypothetical protein
MYKPTGLYLLGELQFFHENNGRRWSYTPMGRERLSVECYALIPHDCYPTEYLREMGRNKTYTDYFYGFYLSLEIVPRAFCAVVKIVFNWFCRKIYAIGSEIIKSILPAR